MTRTTERRVLAEAKRECGRHDAYRVVEEHGGRFVTCTACGALWSVAFSGAGTPLFDVIEHGDESCRPWGK